MINWIVKIARGKINEDQAVSILLVVAILFFLTTLVLLYNLYTSPAKPPREFQQIIITPSPR